MNNKTALQPPVDPQLFATARQCPDQPRVETVLEEYQAEIERAKDCPTWLIGYRPKFSN